MQEKLPVLVVSCDFVCTDLTVFTSAVQYRSLVLESDAKWLVAVLASWCNICAVLLPLFAAAAGSLSLPRLRFGLFFGDKQDELRVSGAAGTGTMPTC